MTSPFPPSASIPGEGHIVAKLLPTGDSGVEKITYQYPLKLISPPRPAERRSVLVFLLSYGGGLVGGDRVDLRIDVNAGARLSVVTQGHTKIFKSPNPASVVTRQTLGCHVAAGAALCLLPDPVQPFEQSVYEQVQVFRLGEGASLCMLDWVTQGRSALGEDWSFVKWVGRNEVWATSTTASAASDDGACDRLLVKDAVILDRDNSAAYGRSIKDTMHGMGIFGTLILRGPLVTSLGAFFTAEFSALPRLGARDFTSPEAKKKAEVEEQEAIMSATLSLEKWRSERLRMERSCGILWSVANVRGCIVVKFGATTVEGGRLWVSTMIAREGSIAENFGEHSLTCIL